MFFSLLLCLFITEDESYIYGNPALERREIDGLTFAANIMSDAGVVVGGIISKWTVYAKRTGQLHLQVWRRQGTTKYFRLVGQVSKTCTQTGVHELTGTEAGNVHVKKGDVLGFYFTDQSLIPFDVGVCETDPQVYELKRSSPPVVGQTYQTLQVIQQNRPCRLYSFQVDL